MNRTTLGRLVGGLHAFRELVLAAAFLVLSGYASTASAQTSFYDAPKSLLAGQPGTLVRRQPIDGAPLGAAAYRVLYRSTGMRGRTDFRVGGRGGTAGRAAGRWPPDRRLGTPDLRHHAALRAVPGDLPVPADAGTALVCRTRLCRCRNRLSRSWHGRTPSLSGWRQRSPRGNRRGTCCGQPARRRRRKALLRSGATRKADKPRSSPA